jgi:hypothetical protein
MFAIGGASELNVFLHPTLCFIEHECNACPETKIQTDIHNGVMFFSAANTNYYNTLLPRKGRHLKCKVATRQTRTKENEYFYDMNGKKNSVFKHETFSILLNCIIRMFLD